MSPNSSRSSVSTLVIGGELHFVPSFFFLSSLQGKLHDAGQPRVVSSCPGLPGRMPRPPVPGSRPGAAEDGPADPGETPLPLQRRAASRQGQVSSPRWSKRPHITQTVSFCGSLSGRLQNMETER